MARIDIKELGRRVKEARERARLTQANLAEAAGVTDETISRLERGAFEPALSTLLAVAEELALDVGALLAASWYPGPITAREVAAPPSRVVQRLAARVELLAPAAQRALLRVAELLPTRAGYGLPEEE